MTVGTLSSCLCSRRPAHHAVQRCDDGGVRDRLLPGGLLHTLPLPPPRLARGSPPGAGRGPGGVWGEAAHHRRQAKVWGAPCKEGGGGCYTYTHEWQTSATLTSMAQNMWEIHIVAVFSWCPLLSDVQAVRVTQLLYQRLFHCFSSVINEFWFSFFSRKFEISRIRSYYKCYFLDSF